MTKEMSEKKEKQALEIMDLLLERIKSPATPTAALPELTMAWCHISR